jgi:hypothetical protein
MVNVYCDYTSICKYICKYIYIYIYIIIYIYIYVYSYCHFIVGVLHVRCTPQPNSQRQFWTSVWESCVWGSCVWASCVWGSCVWESERVVWERVVCERVVCEGGVCELCVRELCVREFCVKELRVSKLCVVGLCVAELCVREWESCVWASCVWESCVWGSCVWELCARELCVSKLCVRELCVSKLCVRELCVRELCRRIVCERVRELCLRESRRKARQGDGRGCTTKTKNPTQTLGEQWWRAFCTHAWSWPCDRFWNDHENSPRSEFTDSSTVRFARVPTQANIADCASGLVARPFWTKFAKLQQMWHMCDNVLKRIRMELERRDTTWVETGKKVRCVVPRWKERVHQTMFSKNTTMKPHRQWAEACCLRKSGEWCLCAFVANLTWNAIAVWSKGRSGWAHKYCAQIENCGIPQGCFGFKFQYLPKNSTKYVQTMFGVCEIVVFTAWLRPGCIAQNELDHILKAANHGMHKMTFSYVLTCHSTTSKRVLRFQSPVKVHENTFFIFFVPFYGISPRFQQYI